MSAMITSNRDLRDRSNRIQARFELHRAIDRNNPQLLANWAKEWGEAALHEADPDTACEKPSDLLTRLVREAESELSIAADTLDQIKDEVERLRK